MRVGFRDFVLYHVPVFGQDAILDADDIGDDPVGSVTPAGEPAVEDDMVASATASWFS